MAESVPEKGAEAVATEVDLKADEATMEATRSFKAIVLGATGATGRYLVGELLASKVGVDLEESQAIGHARPATN